MKRTAQYIRNSLISCYSHYEIESFIEIIFEHIYNYSKNDLILKSSEIVAEHDFHRVVEIVTRLKNHEPIQYILGEAFFYDLKFKVEPGVLIPRGETEELVDLIIKQHNNEALKLLDIGTGSGCIPISIKKNRPGYDVYSCDISNYALSIARQNALRHDTKIEFFEFDILSGSDFPYTAFDVVISNPPYVTNKDKQMMEANVLDHEPHLALFVPDNDPLIFYKAIVGYSSTILKVGGMLYFEINEAYGKEVVSLLDQANFESKLLKDINGKDRMISAVKY